MTDQIGAQHPQPDPRGWLVFDHLPAMLQAAEDARAAADVDRLAGGAFERPATATERLLLEHLGHDLTEHPELVTKVQARGVRRRSWPELDPDEPRVRRSWWPWAPR